MKKIAFFLTILLVSAPSMAQKSEFRTDIENVDISRYCLYEEKIYTLGSLIEVGESIIRCKYFSSTTNGIKPGARWIPNKK